MGAFPAVNGLPAGTSPAATGLFGGSSGRRDCPERQPGQRARRYTYDAALQLVKVEQHDGTAYQLVSEMAYDGAGQRTQMSDGLGTTTWTYDHLGRPITVTDPFSASVGYAYDSAGDRLTLTYPDGKTVSYRYDLASRQAQVTDWSSQTTSYGYNAIGQPLTVTLPNGVTSSFGYDHAERLTGITHQGITQTLGSYAYALDAVGNRVSVTETLLLPGTGISTTAIAYNYDALYRLQSANYNTGAVFTYTYDAVGNRLTQTTITNSIAYTYDVANRLVNVAGQAYTWDNNGNLLSDGVLNYAYDSANRPITITQGANTYAFGYDGVGNRRWQNVNGVPTTYTLDLNAGLVQVLADGAGNTYLYGINRIAQSTATATGYFLPDGLGSARQIADASGTVAQENNYDPYGNPLSTFGTALSIYGYTGEVTDATGLSYLWARYYSSSQGRFVTADMWPGDYSRPLTLDAWLYSEGNPVTLTDPTGHQAQGTSTNDCMVGFWVPDQFGIGHWVCFVAPPVTKPKNKTRVHVTAAFLRDYEGAAMALGLRDNRESTLDALPNFGSSPFYANFMPRYSDGRPMRYYSWHPDDVWKLKKIVIP